MVCDTYARVASRSAANVARDTSGKITNVTTSSAWYGKSANVRSAS